MPKGHGQVITTTATSSASRAYDGQWALNRDVTFSKFETRFFWEHGAADRLTLVASTAYQDIDYVTREGEDTVSGFGTSSLGAKYRVFTKGKTVGALQASYVLGGRGEIISDADLGRGGNGLELRGLLSRNFTLFKRDGFVDVQSSWTYRGGIAPDTFKDDFTVGWNITKKRQALLQAFYRKTGPGSLNGDDILPNESIKLQGSIVVTRSKKTSAQFGVFQTVAGRNVVQEKGIFASVWRRY